MERKSFQKFLFFSVVCLFLVSMNVSAGIAQWWTSSSSSSTSSSSTSSTGGVRDTVAPTVTSFIVPQSVTSRAIPILFLKATDNTGVTGYCVTNTFCASNNWSSRAPKSYTPQARFSGNVTLRAYARDAANNVSMAESAMVTGVPQAIAPDLTVTSIIAADTTITQSQRTFQVTDTVTNQGTATAKASKTRYVLHYRYESGNGTEGTVIEKNVGLSGSDRRVPVLYPNKSSTGTVTVTVPAGIERGPWKVKACADADDMIDELNEFDQNCFISETTINVLE